MRDWRRTKREGSGPVTERRPTETELGPATEENANIMGSRGKTRLLCKAKGP